jgi:hypothetical protein
MTGQGGPTRRGMKPVAVGTSTTPITIDTLNRQLIRQVQADGQLAGQATADMPGFSEIRSDFELFEGKYLNPTKSTQLPWGDSADIIRDQSVRQALAIAETERGDAGHIHLHVPSYLCDSVIPPFPRNGRILTELMELMELPLDIDLVVRPADLLSWAVLDHLVKVTQRVTLLSPEAGYQATPSSAPSKLGG